MVLSDNETKLFYQKFEELKQYISSVKTEVEVGKIVTIENVALILSCNELAEQISKIIFDDNEL